MKPKWKVRHAAHERTRAKVILHAAALIYIGTTGFLIGGAAGAAAGVGAWAVVLIAWWQLRARRAPAPPGPAEPKQVSAADIEEVIDRLDDIARERNWDLHKRFDIARMACEYPTMTIDELERRYEEEAKGKA
jgi:hypothetical protein